MNCTVPLREIRSTRAPAVHPEVKAACGFEPRRDDHLDAERQPKGPAATLVLGHAAELGSQTVNKNKFKSICNLGYGNAVYEHRKNRKPTWPMTVALVLIAAVVAFRAGRVSVENKVSSEYEAGFDAGVREGTTSWGEWR